MAQPLHHRAGDQFCLIEAALPPFGGMQWHRDNDQRIQFLRSKSCSYHLRQPTPEYRGHRPNVVILQEMNQFPEHALVAAEGQRSPVRWFVLNARGANAVSRQERWQKISADPTDGLIKGTNLLQAAVTNGNSGDGDQRSAAKTAVTRKN
jgi:hypothetical protein